MKVYAKNTTFHFILCAAIAVIFLFAGPVLCAQSRIDCGAMNSKILKQVVRYCVYLPSGYDAGASQHPPQRYPVLYFLHGLGDNEQTLFNSGGWTLLDDLRHQNKMSDFLIVAPEGRRSFYINSADGSVRYGDFFVQEFIPYIEGHFRIRIGRATRAISGVFVVLTAVAAATLVYLAVPLVLALVMLTSTFAYVGVFWVATKPERASTAGAAPLSQMPPSPPSGVSLKTATCFKVWAS